MNEQYSENLAAAAKELGKALNATPEVQAYLRAEDAVKQSLELCRLNEEMDRVYRELVQRQKAGEMVFPHEVSRFYKMREQLVVHPLMVEREACLKAVKALFEQAGTTINSILSVNFTELAGH